MTVTVIRAALTPLVPTWSIWVAVIAFVIVLGAAISMSTTRSATMVTKTEIIGSYVIAICLPAFIVGISALINGTSFHRVRPMTAATQVAVEHAYGVTLKDFTIPYNGEFTNAWVVSVDASLTAVRIGRTGDALTVYRASADATRLVPWDVALNDAPPASAAAPSPVAGATVRGR